MAFKSGGTAFVTASLTDTDRRALEQARLDLVADAMAYGRLQTPLWSALTVICFSGIVPGLSGGLDAMLGFWLVAQCAAGYVLHLAYEYWPRGRAVGPFGISRRFAYAAAYAVAGLGWGLMPAATLTADNLMALSLTAVTLIGVLAVYSSRITPSTEVYLTAVTAFMIASAPAFALCGGDNGLYVAFIGPVWVAMGAAPALKLSRRIGDMIETRFQNEALLAEHERSRVAAEEANRAKSNFLANISHELRTPLNAIIGFSDVMREGLFGRLDARYQSYAEDIHGSGEHLLSLINDLLDIAKIEAGRMAIVPEAFSPADEVQQVARLIGPKARDKRQTVSVALANAPAEMLADMRAFKQIALNIAGNAVKFTQAGGAIEIGVRDENGDAVLWVRDNGPGIPADRIAALFKPFERVDNAYSGAAGGTGLGLSLVKALAGLHGGTVTLESEVGDGTLVSVRFPGASRAAPQALAA